MKKYILNILAIGAVVFFSGCADELEKKFTQKYTGEEIVFGARATYELNESNGKKNAPATRTVYTGTFLGADGKEWVSGAKYEGVKWIAGDQVRIYCPQAAGYKTADYTVTLGENEQAHVASLVRNSNYDGALQWGDLNSTHQFYAVYPAPSYFTDGPQNTEVLNNGTKLKGQIPSVQAHTGSITEKEISIVIGAHDDLPALTGTTKGKNYIVSPNMEYAYMVARRDIVPANTPDEIYLNFIPVATAVEITIQNLARNNDFPNGQTLHLTNVLINSEKYICGEFNVDLANINEDGTFAVAEPFTNGETSKQIALPMFKDGLYGDPISLNFGDAVTFTVFMLPTTDLNNLEIVLQGLGGTKTGNLNGISITKRKKTYIKNIPFVGKNVLPFTQSEWMRFIENDVNTKELSIPGAGGAASGEKYALGQSTDLGDTDRQQNLTIEQLWEKGIRCFEFATDIPSTITDDISLLGKQNVICNGKSCGITLDEAISKVTDQLNAHKKEFAMVILTYQTLGGWNQRKPATYMSLLNKYWPTVASKLDEGCSLGNYSSSATMQNSRGKLFCIARPTSIHQDYGTQVVTPSSGWKWSSFSTETTYNPSTIEFSSLGIESPVNGIIVIHGWGALKDKWQQRGYTNTSYRQYSTGGDGPGRPFDVSTVYDHDGSLGYHNNDDFETRTINGKNWYGYFPKESYTANNLVADFSYETSTGSTAWVQEWTRVSQENLFITREEENCIHLFITYGKKSKVICWNDTYDEKVGHMKDALSRAINKTGNCEIYINSLCGYFIDSSIEQSYMPCVLTDFNASNSNKGLSSASQTAGLQGNIQSFAQTINQDFYDHLQDVTSGYVPGSMGIILMDRVGEVVNGNDASNKIPGIIIANNFQHETSTVTKLAIPKDPDGYNEENGDKIYAPARRDAKGDGIVWK